MISEVVVVIPARNEEFLIEACLRSVRAATRDGRVIVVADSCTDRTAEIARGYAEVIEIHAASVGTTRAAGVARAIETSSTPLDELWIANTDADSVVPSHWIDYQLALDTDVFVGTVRPSEADLSAEEWVLWHATHEGGQAIGNVHGANLGVRASAYLAAGGFEAVDEHEDNDLVHRLYSAGFEISASDQCEVVTSGRRIGRTPGGYAGYLRSGAYAPAPDLV